MSIWCKLHLPKDTQTTVQRLIDLTKLAAAEHYRLCSYVDPETMSFVPLGEFASDFTPNVRVIERTSDKTWETVLRKELNTNIPTGKSKTPLWKVAIVVSPKMAAEYKNSLTKKDGTSSLDIETLKSQSDDKPIEEIKEDSKEMKDHVAQKDSKDIKDVIEIKEEKEEYFEIAFSFHHCLGDGLSMWAFSRTFMQFSHRDYLTKSDLNLNQIPLSKAPPPILDNLMNPGFIEIFPAAMSMIVSSMTKSKRYKGRKSDDEVTIGSYNDEEDADSQAASIQDMSKLPMETTRLKPPPNSKRTSTRFLFYTTDFVSSLRKKAKAEGTTIAAVLVVNALAAVRTAFADLPKYKKKKFPIRQGWVVTNSMRHLLPNSQLLYGADKQTDPSVMVFGGYAGSVMNANLKIDDKNDFWERCRTVRRGIITNFRASLNRLKLANYLYRRPKLFNYIKSKVHIDKLSRHYSVELANLGAWDCPTANQDSLPEDARLKVTQFGGIINSSFDG